MQNKKIVARLNGGLGNQMFQYAFGRALAIRVNGIFYLEAGMIKSDPLRVYALSGLRIQGELIDTATLQKEILWPLSIARRCPWLPTLPGYLRYLPEKAFIFDPHAMDVDESVYTDGYWQSPKYFEDSAAAIREDFQLAEPLTEERQEIAAKIASVNAVSLHVRRGDYVSNPRTQAFHGLCSAAWYEQAMTQIAHDVEQPYFFVFSDDPTWCRANLSGDWPVHFVEHQSDGRDFEDMHMMSMCHHHIIANSSFSWWGAWMGGAPDKRVIAPQRWFLTNEKDTKDLIPSNWERM